MLMIAYHQIHMSGFLQPEDFLLLYLWLLFLSSPYSHLVCIVVFYMLGTALSHLLL